MITQRLASTTRDDAGTSSLPSLPPLMTSAERLEAQFRLIAQPKTLDVFLKTIKFFTATKGPSRTDESSALTATAIDKDVVEKVGHDWTCAVIA